MFGQGFHQKCSFTFYGVRAYSVQFLWARRQKKDIPKQIENNLKKAGANEVCSISSISNKGISSILRKISFAIVNVDKNTKQET